MHVLKIFLFFSATNIIKFLDTDISIEKEQFDFNDEKFDYRIKNTIFSDHWGTLPPFGVAYDNLNKF